MDSHGRPTGNAAIVAFQEPVSYRRSPFAEDGVITWLACVRGDPEVATGDGLLDRGPLDPFPTAALIDDGHLALPTEGWPDLPTPVPGERVTWRSGFSPTQPAVIGMAVDAGTLPTAADLRTDGAVRLLDLTDGRWLAVMAEVDAWPDAVDPVLLVRPLAALPVGHDVAVIVTTDAADRPATFDPVRGAHLLDAAEAAGLSPDDVALAFSFPVDDPTGPVRAAVASRASPGGFLFDRVRNADLGDDVAPYTWRAAEGRFDVTTFLVDGRTLDLDADGVPRPTGIDTAPLYVHLPTSVAHAPGTAPVLLFGHGIFGQPSDYLDDRDDEDALLALAEELGAVVVATNWRGLAAQDRADVVEVAADFGQIPVVTDRLVQAQVDVATLLDLVRDGLFEAPELLGADGQVVADPERILYYGISLGGIEGAVLAAQGHGLERHALHVPGAQWSTMLERSSNWVVFEYLMVDAVTDPADRQRLYAASQLWWDPVDPMSWVPDLLGTELLLQESIGDEQVRNLTTDALARSLGLDQLQPVVSTVAGLPGASSSTRALVQFDPDVGLPPETNRPAEVTGAHQLPRTWSGTRAQVRAWLEGGPIVPACGEAPCAAANTGG